MISSHINFPLDNSTAETEKILELNGICKKFGCIGSGGKRLLNREFWALKDIALEAKRGEIIGIVGRNGAGKTTLLNIIAGITTPDSGKISVKGKVFGLFNLGAGFQDELSGTENIFLNGVLLGASKREIKEKFDLITGFSELGDFINMPLGAYSQGMRLRLGFSIAVNLDCDILIIDEILSVGDCLFQDKCLRKLTEFRQSGKTMIITSQNMDLIRRLCDKTVLLDHGSVVFDGDPEETVSRYYSLLDKEQFFVGRQDPGKQLVENTKKWAEDPENWSHTFGSKEIIIDSVKLKNGFGFSCRRIRSGHSMEIRMDFLVKNSVKEPHFGIAIFRTDKVYCYGPNTQFDGIRIPFLREGRGSIIFHCPKVMLAPGEYVISVAAWDKYEALPFDYHNGCYKLEITGGNNPCGALLNLPIARSFKKGPDPDSSQLENAWEKKCDHPEIKLNLLLITDIHGRQKKDFLTEEGLKVIVGLGKVARHKNRHLWVGLYRDDRVYCQGVTMPLAKEKIYEFIFPKILLLAGQYRVSLGVWDSAEKQFIMFCHGLYNLGVLSEYKDHGTVYLEHTWKTHIQTK